MNEIAKQFYDRCLTTSVYSEKLLCINNAFFCLYREQASQKASAVCNINEKTYSDAVEYCREDSESPRVILSQSQVSMLEQYLSSVFK